MADLPRGWKIRGNELEIPATIVHHWVALSGLQWCVVQMGPEYVTIACETDVDPKPEDTDDE